MIEHTIETMAAFMWTYPVVILCVLAGVFYTFRLKFVQITGFKHAIELVSGKYDNPNEEGQITHFQALFAALSGTIGIGNMAGVAIAIALGGPGAVFWMWIIAFFGMATKYAECALGTIYRGHDPVTGEVRGGPMYYIQEGLGKKWRPLALTYAICIAIGAMGVGGMFQANQATSAFAEQFGISMELTGIAVAILLGLVIIGGIKRIGAVAGKLVPTMCVLYLLLVVYVLVTHAGSIPSMLGIIFNDAFAGTAVMGGAVGEVIRMGIRRAVFSNEAGIGSASIAHAAVKTNYPIREGIVASLGPLIDTIVVCTATALIIISSGFYGLGRYEAVNEGFSFHDFKASSRITNTFHVSDFGVPLDKHEFQKFRTGDQALAIYSYSNNYAGTSPFNIKDLLKGANVDDIAGLRFSMYMSPSDKTSHGIMVVDENGNEIKHYSLTKEEDDLKGNITYGNWHHRLLPVTQEMIDNNYSIMVFAAGAGNLYIDNITPVKETNGIVLTAKAFDHFFPGYGQLFIALAAMLFGFSTMITWSYYGETGAIFMFGNRAVLPYKLLFILLCLVGPFLGLSMIVNLSDLLVGFMVIPNAIAIIALSGVVTRETKIYFDKLKRNELEVYK